MVFSLLLFVLIFVSQYGMLYCRHIARLSMVSLYFLFVIHFYTVTSLIYSLSLLLHFSSHFHSSIFIPFLLIFVFVKIVFNMEPLLDMSLVQVTFSLLVGTCPQCTMFSYRQVPKRGYIIDFYHDGWWFGSISVTFSPNYHTRFTSWPNHLLCHFTTHPLSTCYVFFICQISLNTMLQQNTMLQWNAAGATAGLGRSAPALLRSADGPHLSEITWFMLHTKYHAAAEYHVAAKYHVAFFVGLA